MEHKFLNQTKKISISQVNFKEYFEFYKDFICPYLYKYTLEDNSDIEITFSEENFGHLLGLHKLKTFKNFKNSFELIENIINSKKTIKDIQMAERTTLDNRELKDRLTYFPVLRTLLENADIVLKYNINVIWNSKIEFSFLIKTDKIAIIIYLAVKEIKNNKKICVPVSFLVDRNDRFSKLGLKKLKIIDREIIRR